MPSALFLVPQEFEELELVAPVDLLRRAGVEVTLASTGDSIHLTGRNGITLHANAVLGVLDGSTPFDLLVLPGGPGVKHLRADARVIARVQEQAKAGRWLAAICAAPTVLLDAGVLPERYAAHPSTAAELPSALPQCVVQAGRIVTSRGAGTAIDFGLALVEALTSSEKAHEIARAICHAQVR